MVGDRWALDWIDKKVQLEVKFLILNTNIERTTLLQRVSIIFLFGSLANKFKCFPKHAKGILNS